MATVEENRDTWNTYDWPEGGDEWSWEWGGTAAMWYGTLLPRLYRWLPAGTILEIAPGFGRWTQFLKDQAGELIVVDLSEKCISACRERFAGATNIAYHVNDGRSLAMIPDRTIDFAFSFDSLVHVEGDVLQAYLTELSSKLRPDGIGFIHHSNLGNWLPQLRWGRRLQRLPRPLNGANGWLLRHGKITVNSHVRAESATAQLFVELCERADLRCIAQEIVNWGQPLLNDCFSVFTPAGSRHAKPFEVVENPHFMDEAVASTARKRLYEGETK